MLNDNVKKCIETALNESYLNGYRDAKGGKESAVAAQTIKPTTAETPKEIKDEWSGKWITEGGMFVLVFKDKTDTWLGNIYDDFGNTILLHIKYDKDGKTLHGKAFWLKEKLSGSLKESWWPTVKPAQP